MVKLSCVRRTGLWLGDDAVVKDVYQLGQSVQSDLVRNPLLGQFQTVDGHTQANATVN